MQVVRTAATAAAKGYGFFRRQQRDWKISLVRSNTHMFLHRLIDPYLSIYIIALGATATQLGLINSIGMVVAGIFSLFIGTLIDRVGVKKVYLLTIAMLILAYFVYGIAQSWVIAIYKIRQEIAGWWR